MELNSNTVNGCGKGFSSGCVELSDIDCDPLMFHPATEQVPRYSQILTEIDFGSIPMINDAANARNGAANDDSMSF